MEPHNAFSRMQNFILILIDTKMTVNELSKQITTLLTPRYGKEEAPWIARIIFEKVKGWTRTDMLVHADDEASDFVVEQITEIARKCADGTPIQYVIGETQWHGLKLKVTPDVLIPRPETSMLVDIIADTVEGRSDLNVLDLCTGSGCIAVALARQLPFAKVSAGDISTKALDVARENAELTKTKINFFECDVRLPLPLPDGTQDVIVANPPYVLESERKEMEEHVEAHEPALALFVPDDDPLRFYTPIAREASRLLKPGGYLFFEINPLCAGEMRKMLAAEGFADVNIQKDMYGKDRFAICKF